jgi:phospholipase/carboxylesterase
MRTRREVLGGLECQTVDWLADGEQPGLAVVCCHGFGAPGRDLVVLASDLVTLQPGLTDVARFVFPAGPMALDNLGMSGGRAWWYIDVNRLVTAVERGETHLLRNDRPAGLAEARIMLAALVEELQGATGLPASRIVLGGFSQGAMLTTDLALRMPDCPGGLCILSGTLACEDEWRHLARNRGPLPVVQSHGYEDQILPFEAAEWLRDLLVEARLEVDFVPFHGMHSIPPEALRRAAALLMRVADSGRIRS